MAITKTKHLLSIVAEFVDEDDRTLTVENPDGINWETGEVSAALISKIQASATHAAKVLIGDKTGAAFRRYRSAKAVEQTTHYLQFTPAA